MRPYTPLLVCNPIWRPKILQTDPTPRKVTDFVTIIYHLIQIFSQCKTIPFKLVYVPNSVAEPEPQPQPPGAATFRVEPEPIFF